MLASSTWINGISIAVIAAAIVRVWLTEPRRRLLRKERRHDKEPIDLP